MADQLLVHAVVEGRLDGHATELGGAEAREETGLLVVDQDVGPRRAPGTIENDDRSVVAHACLPYSCMKTAGTRGPFWMKFFMPMS